MPQENTTPSQDQLVAEFVAWNNDQPTPADTPSLWGIDLNAILKEH
jgi:hypothetical protein